MKIPPNALIIVVILLLMTIISFLGVIWLYQQNEKSVEVIYEIKMDVRQKLIIDSVLSVYEARHRSRLDSIEKSYQARLDSVSILIDQLKHESNVLQTSLQPVDSVLPVY